LVYLHTMIKIIHFNSTYTIQCANLLQYLWKEDAEGRLKRFKWSYFENPNTVMPLSIIAVNENDEVIGFRGFFIFDYICGNQKIKVASIADTVVSPKARRQGILKRMMEFSLIYLKDNNISLINDLGPSWSPYGCYKKLGFEDLSFFKSKYRFNFFRLLLNKIGLKINTIPDSFYFEKKITDITYTISTNTTPEILTKLSNFNDRPIHYLFNADYLEWRFKRPFAKYIYAYAIDDKNNLLSFILIKNNFNKLYNIGFIKSKSNTVTKKLYVLFNKIYKPSIVAFWSFALPNSTFSLAKKLHLYSIPFINKVRKNPPALVRTLQTKADGSLNWFVNGLDIRDVKNWEVNKFDGDSF